MEPENPEEPQQQVPVADAEKQPPSEDADALDPKVLTAVERIVSSRVGKMQATYEKKYKDQQSKLDTWKPIVDAAGLDDEQKANALRTTKVSARENALLSKEFPGVPVEAIAKLSGDYEEKSEFLRSLAQGLGAELKAELAKSSAAPSTLKRRETPPALGGGEPQEAVTKDNIDALYLAGKVPSDKYRTFLQTGQI